MRWLHPERGAVSPAEFVALAEETSLIVPIGEYVIDLACAAVTRFIAAGADPIPFVAVNVSARQLSHPGLIDRIVARVEAASLPRSAPTSSSRASRHRRSSRRCARCAAATRRVT